MDPSKPVSPDQALAPRGSICPHCGTEAVFDTDHCVRCGALFYAPNPHKVVRRPRRQTPRIRPGEQASGAGGLLVLGVVILGAVVVISKYQMIPVIRGMQVGTPLICFIAVAILIVLWGSKFFDSH